MENHKKKVLVVARLFPPIGGSGIFRIVKNVKFLVEEGWDVSVLTTNRMSDDKWSVDKTLIQEVEKARIFRTPTIDCRAPRWLPQSIFRMVERILAYVSVPDQYVFWLVFAVLQGKRIIKKESTNVLYASGPPFTNLLVARVLSFFARIPVCSEFRDPWHMNPYSSQKWITKPRKYVEKFLEKWIVRNSSSLIVVTMGMNQLYERTYPSLKKRGIVNCVYNGFDEEDFDGVSYSSQSAKFIISYVGSFFSFRHPIFFLDAFVQAAQKDNRLREVTEIHFVGPFHDGVQQKVIEVIRRYRLEDVVYCDGSVSHHACIELQTTAAVNLFITGNQPGGDIIIAGKVFEYIRSKKRILALTYPQGEAAHIIKQSGLGVVVPQQDTEQISLAIRDVFEEWIQGRHPQWNEEYVCRFSRQNTARQISHILSDILPSEKVK